MSRHSSGGYVGERRLTDDLSDRIYGAYHALSGVSIKGRSARIAEALSRSKASISKTDWSYADIDDRVKKYERQERRSLKGRGLNDDALQAEIERFRACRADAWIAAFKFAQSVRIPKSE